MSRDAQPFDTAEIESDEQYAEIIKNADINIIDARAARMHATARRARVSPPRADAAAAGEDTTAATRPPPWRADVPRLRTRTRTRQPPLQPAAVRRCNPNDGSLARAIRSIRSGAGRACVSSPRARA